MHRPHILVIEKWSNLALLYAEELRDEGYEVFVVGELTQALRLPGRSTFDLVLVDGGSSLLDATSTTREVRQGFPGTPVVVSATLPMLCLAQGHRIADAVVSKSSDLTELKRVVRSTIRPD